MSDIIYRLKEAGVSIGTRKILFEKKYVLQEGDSVKLRIASINKIYERFKHSTGIITDVNEFEEICWVEWVDEIAKESLQKKFIFEELLRVKK